MTYRIVPIPVPSKHRDAIMAAGPQKLVYHGGPLLTSVQVKAIFWGDAWTSDPTASATAGPIKQFLQWIVTSPLVDQLAEYSTPTQKIVRGAYQGFVVVPGAVKATIADSDVQTMLTTLWKTEPSLGPNALWPVFLPPNVQISAFSESSCVDFCGYHEALANTAYAVMPFPDCTPCLGGMPAIDSLTTVVSHEVCEAITDPFANGWYAPSGYEIGDLCATPTWQTKQLNGYTVQKEWSNNQSGCV
jgi:hypothetical protein